MIGWRISLQEEFFFSIFCSVSQILQHLLIWLYRAFSFGMLLFSQANAILD